MDSKRIAAKLIELRSALNLTQYEIADKLNITQSAYAMYESGKRIPRDEIKITIANFFKLTVQEIFYN